MKVAVGALAVAVLCLLGVGLAHHGAEEWHGAGLFLMFILTGGIIGGAVIAILWAAGDGD